MNKPNLQVLTIHGDAAGWFTPWANTQAPDQLSSQVTVALDSSLSDRVRVHRSDARSYQVSAGSRRLLNRGLGTVLCGTVSVGQTVEERSAFDDLGVMIDCSRNAVPRVDYLIDLIHRLALLGFNQLLLYLEDTYELPDEPYFGYQRGRYTAEELRALDQAAMEAGVEVVACIQTLAHLEQVFRWPGYDHLRDQGTCMRVGYEPVYGLVGKMLDTVGSCLRSRRIHLGMDEAWDMGRGRTLDEGGVADRFTLFTTHLQRVAAMAQERGLAPMIWSDMIFNTATIKRGWYEPDAVFRPDVAVRLPAGVDLVYWDYYRTRREDYSAILAKHRELGVEPIMASGVWTWSQLWYNHHKTQSAARPCIHACRDMGVRRLFFTMWGDDGAYCDWDSPWAGLAWVAELAHNPDANDAAAAARLAAVVGGDFDAVILASELTEPFATAAVLWDDPLLGIFANDGLPPDMPGRVTWDHMLARFESVAARLPDWPEHPAGDLRHARLLARTLSAKTHLRQELESAYDVQDRRRLSESAADAVRVVRLLEELLASFRRRWMSRNKPQGFEVLQIRLAGLMERHRELVRRIEAFVAGDPKALPELDQRPSPARGIGGTYRLLATASPHL